MKKKLLFTSLISSVFCSIQITAQSVISTYAGTGTAGSVNGAAASSTFYKPTSLACDAAGNVFVADFTSNKIRKITPAGIVSTYAGTGTPGSANGAAAVATFSNPNYIATDASGNVYVAESATSRIRKITTTGIVSTLVLMTNPNGLAFDGVNSLYASTPNTIYKIDLTTSVSTLYAGSNTTGSTDGPAASASFNQISGLVVDAFGNLYVTDAGNYKIRKVTPAGVVSTFAGSGTFGYLDGAANVARFRTMFQMIFDASGNLLVVDGTSYRIRSITPSGVVSTYAGNGVSNVLNGPIASAELGDPRGISKDASGNIFISEFTDNIIRKITPACITPTITANVTNSVICLGNSITFNGSGANTYTWTAGVTDNVSYTPTITGVQNYTVTGAQTGSCTLSNTAAISVTVNSNPTVSITSSNTLICSGQTTSLTASGATSYTWNTSATTNVIAITPSTTTVYTVTGEDGNGCTNVATITQSVSTCTGNWLLSQVESPILIYPNPTKGIFTLELNETSSVLITNTLGQIIFNEKVPDGKHVLDIQNNIKGLYFVTINNNNKIQTFKIVLD